MSYQNLHYLLYLASYTRSPCFSRFVDILNGLAWHEDFKSIFACMKDCLEDKFRHDSSKDRIYEVSALALTVTA